MPFSYLAPTFPFLKQGEVIQNLAELRPVVSSSDSLTLLSNPPVDKIDYTYAILVSQDCDLRWDYAARQEDPSSGGRIEHILLCELFLEDEIHNRNDIGGELWRRVKQNQNLRYHRIDSANIHDTEEVLPKLYADFRTVFSLPTDFVYWLVENQIAKRKGFLPSPYLEYFMQRLYSFLGRIATPDE